MNAKELKAYIAAGAVKNISIFKRSTWEVWVEIYGADSSEGSLQDARGKIRTWPDIASGYNYIRKIGWLGTICVDDALCWVKDSKKHKWRRLAVCVPAPKPADEADPVLTIKRGGSK